MAKEVADEIGQEDDKNEINGIIAEGIAKKYSIDQKAGHHTGFG